MIRRLAIAVGDTAGHVIPALAIAEAYNDLAGPVDVRFFAAGEGTGHWLVERAGYRLDLVPGSPLARVGPLDQLAALSRVVRGATHARALLARDRVRLVIGTGGYGSASALLVARLLGLRTALIEPNVVPGLTNRLLGRVVHRAYVAFDETARRFPAGRAIVTGVPAIRTSRARTASEKSLPLLPRVRLLVTSGSRGEAFLAEQLPPLVCALRLRGAEVEVRHQGGTRAVGIERAYRQLGVAASVSPFIDDMTEALDWADFVIARAGAGTMADVALAGVPSLLVPLADAAHDHQTANAAALVDRGAALSIREQEWDTDMVADRLLAALRDANGWQAMSRAARALAAPDAAGRIVRDCEALMEGRW